MLLKGLPRVQLLLPAWTARNLAFARQRASQSSSREANGGSQQPDGQTLSLFDELFPEESRKEKSSPRITGGFQVPVRRVGTEKRVQKYLTLNANTSPVSAARESRADEDQFQELQDVSVLVLSNASKSLSLSDFLRLSPKGEHIDGWASGIIKVIPGRNPNTLEAQGHYFILFSTDVAAREYMNKLTRLHRISQVHTPTSITSPLPPPPGYLKDGEDLHGLIQAFTLIPSSQHHISIRMLKKPFRPAMQRLIALGGHPAIVARQSKSENLVLLSLDKGPVAVYDLRAAIGRDGKERNLQWNLLLGKDDIVKLDGGKALSEEEERAAELDKLQGLEEKRRKRWQLPRFVVSFKDNQEARRFVRGWHRRPFPLARGLHNPGDEGPPMVNAELLW